jgi:opacity protein-like surface antigen
MSNRHLVLSVLVASSLGAAVMPGPAFAADLDPPFLGSQQDPPDRVDFGTGWYIRGDLGATRLPSVSVGAPSGLPTASANGTITNPNANPSAPTASVRNGSDIGYTASLGAGYQFNSWLRADLIGDFNKPVVSTSSSGGGAVPCVTAVNYPTSTTTGAIVDNPTYANGGCTGAYSAKLSSYDVLANIYVDLGKWYGITPYVGAGIGMGFGHYATSSAFTMANGNPYQVTYSDAYFNTSFYQNFNRQSSGTYYNFAWALMGGFAIDVFSHTKLDIGYRYRDLGSVPGLSGNLTSQEVRAGVRYMIDN